jgi:cell wall-associated NlpC family hydrolase
MEAYFQIIDSETFRSIPYASLTVSERGTSVGLSYVSINYDAVSEVYTVSGLSLWVCDYNLIVQKDGYEDALQEFSISPQNVSAQNSGNVYVINPSLSIIPIVMQAIPLIEEAFIYYQDTVDPSLAYPLDTHRVDIKAILRVQVGLFINRLYSDTAINPGATPSRPWWIAGSRGPLNPDPANPINAFTSTPYLNGQVYAWPNDWPAPTFSWEELLHRGSDAPAHPPYNRDYIYQRNNYSRVTNWGGQVQLNAGSRRFRVEVTLNGNTFSSTDEEQSTRISVRDSTTPDGCNTRVTQYLRWLTAFLEIPYEWGGSWFGGMTGNGVGGGGCYEGYGIDCSGFVSCGARFAGYTWTGGRAGCEHGTWRHVTATLNNVLDQINNDNLQPGDILNSPGHHVVTVIQVIDTSNPLNIRINVIESKGTPINKVRIWTNRSLQNDFLNNHYTLRRIGLSITSIAPNSGPAACVTTIVIDGTRFLNTTTVQFGANAGTGFTFVSSTRIRINSPAGAAGAVDLTVTNPDGESFTLRGGFTYVP